jgi:DNA-binding transcriptional regulator YiaG
MQAFEVLLFVYWCLFGYCFLVIVSFFLYPIHHPVVKFSVVKKDASSKAQWDSQSVQALRRHLGLTQNELSEQLGTRQQTVSEWETGMYQPRGASAKLLSLIAEKARFKYDASPKKP